MKLSKNGVGLIILIFASIGINLDEAIVLSTWEALAQIIAFGLMVWNQWQRPDVKNFVIKD